MNQLQLCKLFAELEFGDLLDESVIELGGKLVLLSEMGDIMFEGNDIDYPLEFNPITDLALTMRAMIDYKVQKTTSMVNHGVTIISIRGGVAIKITDDAEAPKAIIECILKSKGKL